VNRTYAERGVPFLSTHHIKPGQVLFQDLKFLTLEEAQNQWKKCKPQKGDVLYTKGGTTGIAAAIDFDMDIAVWVHVGE
jgi:type I restriction enzyme S subunit